MSKLARQLGLPSIPPALRPSRVMRAMEFPMRAPSTPKGVAPLPRKRTTGADYDTEWARSKPARMARAAIVDGPMRLCVAGLASPDRQGADRLLELEGPVIFAPTITATSTPHSCSPRSPSRGGTRSWSVQLPTTSSEPASPVPCRHSVSGHPDRTGEDRPQERRPRRRTHRRRLEPPDLPRRWPQP